MNMISLSMKSTESRLNYNNIISLILASTLLYGSMVWWFLPIAAGEKDVKLQENALQSDEILKKANIDVSEDDIKKVQAAVADGKLELGDLKNLAGGFLKK